MGIAEGSRSSVSGQKRQLSKLRNGLAFLFVLYVTVAHIGVMSAPGGEYFPVFSWSLFSVVRDQVTEPELEITEMNGKPFDEPATYFSMTDRFVEARRRNIELRKMLYRFLALEWSSGDNSALRRQIEQKFLGEAQSAKWQIVAIRYRPLDRHRHGEIMDREVLYRGEFSR